MAWKGVITNGGNDLLNQWVKGKTLHIIRAESGTGRVSETALMAQTELVGKKQEVSMLAHTAAEHGQRLKLQVTPQATGYALNQIGIWANVEGEAEKMIALFQTDTDTGVEIPSKENVPDFVYTFYALLEIQNAGGTLKVTIDTNALVSVGAMNEAIEDAFAKCEGVIKSSPEKKELKDGDGFAVVDSADSNKTKRVLWSTIKFALSKIYVPLGRKINNKSMSSDVTLTGTDISVSGSDDTKIDAALSKKVPRSGELVPLGTNILTLRPGRYSVDGVTGDIWVQMNLPVLTWHYEIVVFAAEDYEGLENNHKVITVHPISYNKECIDSYINEMSYDGTWTGWVKNATATPPQEFDLPITDSYDGTLYHRKYCKTQEGIIFLRFAVCKKVGYVEKGDVIGVLPDGYRPSGNVVAIVGVDGIAAGTGIFSAEIQIDPSGQIYVFHVNDKATWIFGTLSFVQG